MQRTREPKCSRVTDPVWYGRFNKITLFQIQILKFCCKSRKIRHSRKTLTFPEIGNEVFNIAEELAASLIASLNSIKFQTVFIQKAILNKKFKPNYLMKRKYCTNICKQKRFIESAPEFIAALTSALASSVLTILRMSPTSTSPSQTEMEVVERSNVIGKLSSNNSSSYDKYLFETPYLV